MDGGLGMPLGAVSPDSAVTPQQWENRRRVPFSPNTPDSLGSTVMDMHSPHQPEGDAEGDRRSHTHPPPPVADFADELARAHLDPVGRQAALGVGGHGGVRSPDSRASQLPATGDLRPLEDVLRSSSLTAAIAAGIISQHKQEAGDGKAAGSSAGDAGGSVRDGGGWRGHRKQSPLRLTETSSPGALTVVSELSSGSSPTAGLSPYTPTPVDRETRREPLTDATPLLPVAEADHSDAPRGSWPQGHAGAEGSWPQGHAGAEGSWPQGHAGAKKAAPAPEDARRAHAETLHAHAEPAPSALLAPGTGASESGARSGGEAAWGGDGLEADVLRQEVAVLKHRLKLASAINAELQDSNTDLEALLQMQEAVHARQGAAAAASPAAPPPAAATTPPRRAAVPMAEGANEGEKEGAAGVGGRRSAQSTPTSSPPRVQTPKSTPTRGTLHAAAARGASGGAAAGLGRSDERDRSASGSAAAKTQRSFYSVGYKELAAEVDAAEARAARAEEDASDCERRASEAEKKQVQMVHAMRVKLSVDAEHSLALLHAHQSEVEALRERVAEREAEHARLLGEAATREEEQRRRASHAETVLSDVRQVFAGVLGCLCDAVCRHAASFKAVGRDPASFPRHPELMHGDMALTSGADAAASSDSRHAPAGQGVGAQGVEGDGMAQGIEKAVDKCLDELAIGVSVSAAQEIRALVCPRAAQVGGCVPQALRWFSY